MANSKAIAALLGPTLIAISLSEALNLRLLTAAVGPNLVHVVYLNGTLLFVAGLSIVRVHNYWTAGWPVLVTITGWMAVLGGLIRMFALVVSRPAQNAAVFALLIVMFATGVVLTIKAYQREARPSRKVAERA